MYTMCECVIDTDRYRERNRDVHHVFVIETQHVRVIEIDRCRERDSDMYRKRKREKEN